MILKFNKAYREAMAKLFHNFFPATIAMVSFVFGKLVLTRFEITLLLLVAIIAVVISYLLRIE
ncbi:MAG: hypothetical protein QM523_04600 [Candidatus Pacebacteria bacterium]|nr:hypothetical protein [Candidatus Paceibacterota bacterium]